MKTSFSLKNVSLGAITLVSMGALLSTISSAHAAALDVHIQGIEQTTEKIEATRGTSTSPSKSSPLNTMRQNVLRNVEGIKTKAIDAIEGGVRGTGTTTLRTAEVAQKIQAFKAEQSSLRLKRFDARMQRTQKRFDAALEREQNISARLDSRMTKLETSGTSQGIARALLSRANEKITVAQTAIATFASHTPVATESDLAPAFALVEKDSLAAILALKDAAAALSTTAQSVTETPTKKTAATSISTSTTKNSQ